MKHNGVENPHSEVSLLNEQASTFVRKNGATSVPQLYAALKDRNPSLSEVDVTDLVWRLIEGGQVDVEDVPPATGSLRQYVRIWERNLWFYASVVISLMTTLVVYTVPSQLPLVALRWIFGSVFVLFIPGYVTVEILFPKGLELDGMTRFALSVGLSLVWVMLVGLLINYTPWGLRLTPIVISLTILTVGLALLGLVRQFTLSVERFRAEAST
jgi:hypothetical protein